MVDNLSHIMIDLETLGTTPGCSILSVGAVRFFPLEDRLGDTFYMVASRESCRNVYLIEDADTIAWWMKQSDKARHVLTQASDTFHPHGIGDVLHGFNNWLMGQGQVSKLRLYGNGADFDNPILSSAYSACSIKPFAGAKWGGRCYRTLKNLDELLGSGFAFGKVSRSGTYHNALDDAITQAKHLMENLARIRGGIKENV